MSGVFGADDAIARVQEQVERAQARAVAARQVQERIEAVRGVGRRVGDGVVVEVDAAGRLRDLRLTREAMSWGPEELARLILAAAVEATREAGAVAVELAAQQWGAADPAVVRLRAEVEERGGADGSAVGRDG